jgi:hypothetical protein
MKNLVILPPYDENSVYRITYPSLMWRRDGYRKVVWIYYKDGTRKRINYARYKMQKYLGIELPKNEHVHHKNENKLDDRIENLEVIKIQDHTRLHATIYVKKIKVCIVCKKYFTLTIQQQSDERCNRKIRKFCSKKCSMKYQYNWKNYL